MTIAFPQEETRAATATTQSTACTCGALRGVCTCNPPAPLSTEHSQPSTPPQSTGPRSPEGKSRSSQNARKHNLSASTPPPSLRQNPTYQLSHQEFLEEFNPITPAQRILVLQLTFVSWKLDQIPELERQLLATPLNAPAPVTLETPATPIDPQQYIIDALNSPGPFPPPPKDPTNDLTALHLQQNHPTPVTRLWDHHRRLLARFQSIVRQIHTLQKKEAEIANQRAQDEEDMERSRRRAKEDFRSPLDEELERIHQNNKQKEEQERQQRLTQMKTTPPPHPTAKEPAKLCQSAPKTAAAQNELPPPENLKSQISNPKPAQNELPLLLPILALLLLLSPNTSAAEAPPHPLMRDFMGLNVHTVQFKPALYAPVCRLLRDYHPMEWDIGKDTTHPTTFPLAINRVDWNELYGKWTKAGYEVDACVMFDSLPAANWQNPSADARAYGQAFAQYFGPSHQAIVTSAEIGNEPAKYSEKEYRPIFENMAKGLRAGDPKLKIATCAVMTGKPDQWSKPMSAIAGLEDLYDILNVHSYPFKDHWPTWRRSYPEDPAIAFLKEIQSVINWRNDHAPGKQVWLTEFGYDSSTKTPAKNGPSKDWIGVTDEQQAQYTVRAFLVLSAMNLDRAYLYFFNDKDEPQLHGASGITRDFKPKPVFYAMAHLYKTLGNYRFTKAITKQEDLYCYEYENPTKPNEKIYVAWSPTAANPQTKLLPIPAQIDRAERMPLSSGDAPTLKTSAAQAGIQAEITQTPIFLYVH